MFNTLITPEVLRSEAGEGSWVVFDCDFNLADKDAGRRRYEAGHVPGARYLDLERDLSNPVSETSGRHPLPNWRRLARVLGDSGVSTDSQVVCYDASGGTMAARLWWLLRWLGHEAVAVLEGGWQGWQKAGLPISGEMPAPKPALFTPHPARDQVIDTETLLDLLGQTGFRLLDARAPERFRGEVEPIDPVAGHIPGAINAPCADNLDAKGRFLPADQLRKRYLALLDGRNPAEAIAMCGSGVTACHTLLAMEHAGLSGARLYAGSWSEWIRDPGRPVATGA